MDLSFFNVDNIRGFKYTKRWLNKNKPNLLEELSLFIEKRPNLKGLSFSNQLWFFIENISDIPKCYCGNNLNFISIPKGYSKYCSNKCSSNSNDTIEKRKKTSLSLYGKEFFTQTTDYIDKVNKTNLNTYGVKWSSQSKDVKDNIKKTNNELYGCDSPFQNDKVKSLIKKTKYKKYGDETYNNPEKIKNSLNEKYSDKEEGEKILNKKILTNKARYGTEHANQNEKIKERNLLATKKMINSKYGVDTVFKLESFQNNIKLKNLNNFYLNHSNLNFISYDEIKKTHIVECEKCGSFEINSSLLYTRNRDKQEICTNCNPISKSYSSSEKEILDFIKSIYNDIILENDKTIIDNKEVDIYIPDLNIAIEYNGLYWHSELFKSNNYHLNKTKACSEKGIRLIHIFEDEWLFKQDIVKSILRNKLGLTENKVFARKCIIKEVNIKDKKTFLDNNHIQGSVGSSINIGLYHNKELVSLMCFTNKKQTNDYNLVRFCNKLDITVTGGASKLLEYFISEYKPKEIISFSDLRWSDGGLYSKLGFKLSNTIQPTYWYFIQNKRYHKFNFRKNRKFLKNFDKTKSEHQIMLENNILRIYDCGLKKWVYKL